MSNNTLDVNYWFNIFIITISGAVVKTTRKYWVWSNVYCDVGASGIRQLFLVTQRLFLFSREGLGFKSTL